MPGNRGRSGRGQQQGPRMPRPLALVALAVVALTAACGSAAPKPSSAGTFTPGAGSSAGPGSSGGTGADNFVMPPFGSNLHVTMTSWLPPAGSPLIPAVVAAKNWYLAWYYSEYVGGTDNRWVAYTGGTAQPGYEHFLKGSLVAGQSFTGTISFSGMNAAPDKALKGDIDVLICVTTAHSTEVFYPS